MKFTSTLRKLGPSASPEISPDAMGFLAALKEKKAFAKIVKPSGHTEIESRIKPALRLSFIVYDPLGHLEDALAKAGFTHIQKINAVLTGTQGICCVRDGHAYIVFRGSASLLDWIIDFLFIPFYWPLRHFGFGSAWLSVRGKITSWLEGVAGDVKDITICGHSLGGGITHLAAMALARKFQVGSVVTFGAPRACFLGTARRYNETRIHGRGEETLGQNSFTVVNQRDVVSKVPFEFLGFREVGRLVYIGFDSKVRYEDDAHMARTRDSMTDTDFMFGFLEEQKLDAFGAHTNPTEKFYANMRRTLSWISEAIPFAKAVLLPPILYILTCLYFMRSGLAHMGEQYMEPFENGRQAWAYQPHEKSGFAKYVSLSIRLVLGCGLIAVFLYGLFHIAVWSVSGLL